MAPLRARPRHQRPEGQATRGKTAVNRLRRVDLLLMRYDPALIRRQHGPFAHAYFVDLGYGAMPLTTVESFERLRLLNPSLQVLGVEIDPARVEAAQVYAQPGLEFRLGGFNLPLGTWPDGTPETVRALRAFNVLRQYPPDQVTAAYARLAEQMLPGGLLVEGTSDPPGQIWTAHLVRRTDDDSQPWRHEALVFSTNFRQPFDPAQFQPVLPKNLIHRIVPGEPIAAFFNAWKQAAASTAGYQVWGARAWFAAAARQLAAEGYAVNLRPRWLRLGFLLWHAHPAAGIGAEQAILPTAS